jgi:hypothetical protein
MDPFDHEAMAVNTVAIELRIVSMLIPLIRRGA